MRYVVGLVFVLFHLGFAAVAIDGAEVTAISEADVVDLVDRNLAPYMMETPNGCQPVSDATAAAPVVAPYVAVIAHLAMESQGTRVVECTYRYRPNEGAKTQLGYAVLLDIPASALGHWYLPRVVTPRRRMSKGAVGLLPII